MHGSSIYDRMGLRKIIFGLKGMKGLRGLGGNVGYERNDGMKKTDR